MSVAEFSERMFLHFFDVSAQFALADRVDERSDFVWLAGGLEFNAAVRQILDPAGDVEAFRDLLYHVAKADSLHVTSKENLLGSHRAIVAPISALAN